MLVARRSSIEVTRATLKNAKTRLSAGTVTKVDVDRAELALLRAEQMEREARHGREQAYRGAGDADPDRGAVPRQGAGDAHRGRRPPQDLDTALKLRPEFRALELSAQAADLQATTDAWRWSPQISAFGNARRFNYDNFGRDRYSWAIGVQLDWVLFDGGARDAERHLANAQEEESRARAEVLRDNIRDDLANGRSLVDTKRQAVAASAPSSWPRRRSSSCARNTRPAPSRRSICSGAGRPGRRPGGAGAVPLRSGGRRPDAAQDRRHLPAALSGGTIRAWAGQSRCARPRAGVAERDLRA